MSYGPNIPNMFRRAASSGPNSPWSEAKRNSRRTTDQIRARDQPHHRQRRLASRCHDAAWPRRRGDRMTDAREFITLIRRCCDDVAGGGRRAASAAGDRVSQQRLSRPVERSRRSVPPGPQAGGLRGRSQCCDRISFCRRCRCQVAGAGCRIDREKSVRDLHGRGLPPAQTAKAATSTIPIPVKPRSSASASGLAFKQFERTLVTLRRHDRAIPENQPASNRPDVREVVSGARIHWLFKPQRSTYVYHERGSEDFDRWRVASRRPDACGALRFEHDPALHRG